MSKQNKIRKLSSVDTPRHAPTTTPATSSEPLNTYTPARVQLQRTGHSLTLAEILKLQLANAQARDAVYATLDVLALIHGLQQRRLSNLVVTSAAPNRTEYLRNPPLGRTLSSYSEAALKAISTEAAEPGIVYDLVFVIADGLSALAVDRHALALLDAALGSLDAWSIAPICVVEQARVAIADPIGEILGAKTSRSEEHTSELQ